MARTPLRLVNRHLGLTAETIVGASAHILSSLSIFLSLLGKSLLSQHSQMATVLFLQTCNTDRGVE